MKKFLLAPIGALIAGLAFPAAWAIDSESAPAASSSRAGVVVPFSEVQKRDSQKRKPQPADVWKAKNGNELKKQEKAEESRKETAAPSVRKDESAKPAPKPAPAEKPAPAPKKDNAAPQPKPAPVPQKKAESAEAPNPAPAAKPAPESAAPKAEKPAEQKAVAEKAAEQKTAAENEPKAAAGNVMYVSDRLYTYVRTGPGNNYKIAGSVNSGDKVIYKGSNGKYSEIIDRKGRDVWILTEELQSTESAPVKIERLEQENKDLKYKLENVDSESVRELKKKSAELSALTERSSSLEKSLKEGEEKLKELTEDNAELKEKSENIETIEKQQWFMKGAGMVIIGFILGVIFVYLPSPRKKRSTFGGW
ncbi:MAG: TIGR04211 family SH3 domain-containing protein [Succinivibrionaceae bacterium]|nr:TIGR04211 family SH3 domain-containing protein [Succinivibrionaceae bacterium]